MSWQIQEAKQRFSALVQQAVEEGPQIVTRHGEEVVVVVAIDEYKRLHNPVQPFNAFLLDGPDLTDLEIVREQIATRVVEL